MRSTTMNPRASRLTVEYSRKRLPLGRAVDQSEAPALAAQLRQRLHTTDEILDFSPNSLNTLEDLLVEYEQSLRGARCELDDLALLQLIRELVAYIGEVFVRHTGGQWDTDGTLYGTSIEFSMPFRVTKEGETYVSSRPTIFSLGNIASDSWDMIVERRRPELYADFRSAKKRHISET